MGSFCKSLKIKKTIAYVLAIFAEVKYHQIRSEKLFELILILQGDF